jgi:hypothetical protein
VHKQGKALSLQIKSVGLCEIIHLVWCEVARLPFDDYTHVGNVRLILGLVKETKF